MRVTNVAAMLTYRSGDVAFPSIITNLPKQNNCMQCLCPYLNNSKTSY